MHPDDIDLRADGAHAYRATQGERSVRVTVSDATLAELGLGPVEEPLLVRRTLELLDPEVLAGVGNDVTLEQLGARVEGFPDVVVARLRT
ncbi:hypothetical protein CLV35_3347 [Motilibacter peucedani]|uniref:Uncharacterized protein n=1 Tax=Motilibacter peucedani TaxID=598650 RepID=A0A420XKU3_9ACTN|nr:hypothetical protein [Motilibacter peucedani]RKS69173.1 hypothetical protein CLV35_3347 [Motilibacter peucedani]